MNYYFSESELGFYCDEVNESMPVDAVRIEEALYLSVLEGQSMGKVIGADAEGAPVLADPPEPSAEELIAQAEETRTALMQEANARIIPLQDADELGIATDEETALLTRLKRYRVILNRLDMSSAPLIEWPDMPV
ncbi:MULTISPECIES: tail fiber assembly protein [Enterobacter cloacae complex]|uniref:tail fiber assembly protein n=1 Tax=Enterobacter cloacae complex TaxID=354276 RepID=UPI00044D8B6B|nr:MULTISPECIES: tail fiber assembly protein [Enterobacter cloacae complex]MBS7092517.1 tail fiber assembly protein [Enterobacter cloacae]AWR67406.1 tail fiber assembly protein [Enterobacter hormaechei subsp. xiangfangensis]AXL98213.1 tail fiber assembly protein [Enterobacter hormaechei subsp. xiangfangensis]EHK3214234.1 tail fiber assembly protein [Enterobacter hormaechei]EHK3220125.1 tail fiber assembly protein [Enterobacter hormaechei]